MTGAWVLFVLAITTNGHGVAATTARFNTEAACQKALDWRKIVYLSVAQAHGVCILDPEPKP